MIAPAGTGYGATTFREYTLARILDLFVFWPLNAHCGEISDLKDCQGTKGYPF